MQRFDVILLDSGIRKIQVLKAIRHLRLDFDLVTCQRCVAYPPAVILEHVSEVEALVAKEDLEREGATVELKLLE